VTLSEKVAGQSVLEALAAHLEDSGISVEEIGRISKMGGYQSIAKLRDADGIDELVKSDLFKWEISPKFEEGPDWPVVDRGPAVKVSARKTSTKAPSEWTTDFIWPDTQIGYFRDVDGELVPTHDEGAIDVALQLLRAVAPSRMVRVGDDLDLPDLGKYRQSPAFSGTTQAALDRNTILGAEQRQAIGSDGEIFYIAGNHEERFSNYLLDNALAAFGLRKGRFPDEAPSAWPVMSIPYLCRLDDFGIEYRPGYPAADVELGPGFRIVHGHYVNARGQTASKYLDREKVSVVYGHIHRREYLARTFVIDGKPVEIFAASPGCLARTDGAVPSMKGGTDLDGRPIIRKGGEDWQQGVAVAHTKGNTTIYTNVPIVSDGPDRVAVYNGREYVSTVNRAVDV